MFINTAKHSNSHAMKKRFSYLCKGFMKDKYRINCACLFSFREFYPGKCTLKKGFYHIPSISKNIK